MIEINGTLYYYAVTFIHVVVGFAVGYHAGARATLRRLGARGRTERP